MSINSYAPGNTIQILATFTTPAGALYDPSSVTVSVLGPASHAVQTPTVVRDSEGTYHADLVCSDPGIWKYKIEGTSPAAAGQGAFVVRESAF